MPDEMYRPLRDTMPWEKRAGTPMPLFAAPSRLPHKTRVKDALIQKHQFWLAVLALPDAPIQNRRAKAARHLGNGGFGCRAGRLSAGHPLRLPGKSEEAMRKKCLSGGNDLLCQCVKTARAIFLYSKGRTETERVCTRFRLPCSARRHISPTLPMPVVRLSCKQGCKRAWGPAAFTAGPRTPCRKNMRS